MAKGKNTSVLRRVFKGIGIFFLSIVGIFLLVFAGWNGIKHIVYSNYYSLMTDLATNPGLNDGYIPQGVTYLEDEKTYLTSGYMSSKGKASRVYSVDENGSTHYAEIYKDDDTVATYHFGGIADYNDYVFVASSSKLLILNKSDVLSKSKAIIQKEVSVNNAASFVFADDTYIYVGEFNDGEKYVTDNKHTVTDGTEYSAIVTAYTISSVVLGIPVAIKEYAIRDQVQGFCVTDNHLVMSTSYGIKHSHYYVYDKPSALSIDTTDSLIPVYYLDSRYQVDDIVGPAMAEGLDYYDGKVINLSEAASNKYIFGKLFFYNKIVGISID